MPKQENPKLEKKELSFKEKMLKLKDKAVELKNKTIDTGAKKLSESSMVIKELKDLEEFIKRSKNSNFTNEETLEKKVFIKRAIVIFTLKNSDFYKDLLVSFPILVTKAWSQSIPLKMSDIDEKQLKKYNINERPALVVFENEKLYKIILGEEKIKKIVKSLNLDINKLIDE